MRKRSSSANEASKPINVNVIQNSQNSLELRSCSSPHNYGKYFKCMFKRKINQTQSFQVSAERDAIAYQPEMEP